MGYQNAKFPKFDPKSQPLRGGYVDEVRPEDLRDGDSPDMLNVHVMGDGVSVRPGYRALYNWGSGGQVRGVGAYRRAVPANDRIVVYQNNLIRTVNVADLANPVVADASGVTLTGTGRMNFLATQDVCYCMDGTNPYTKLSGTTLTQPSTGVSGLAPKKGVIFNNDLFVSGSAATDPSIVYKAGANFDTFSGAGSAQYKFPETVTGLVSGMEALFYFTSNNVHVTRVQDLTLVSGVYSYANRPLETTEGSQGFDTAVYANDKVFFLTPTNKIRVIYKSNSQLGYSTDDLTHRLLRGVSHFMATLDTDQSQGFAYFKPAQSLVCWHLKTAGSTVNDVVLCYSTQYDLFEIHDAKVFSSGVEYKGNYFCGSQVEPKLFLDEVDADDDGAPIAWRYRTKSWCPQGLARKNVFWQTEQYGRMNALANVRVRTFVDDSPVDSYVISKLQPGSVGGIASTPIASGAIGSAGSTDALSSWTYLCTKGKLAKRGVKLAVEYSGADVGGQFSAQYLNFSYEPLPLEASENVGGAASSIGVGEQLYDVTFDALTDVNGDPLLINV